MMVLLLPAMRTFVAGGTVYSEVRPSSDGTYVKTASTTGDNLLAL